jgi:hypothetical protein
MGFTVQKDLVDRYPVDIMGISVMRSSRNWYMGGFL